MRLHFALQIHRVLDDIDANRHLLELLKEPIGRLMAGNPEVINLLKDMGINVMPQELGGHYASFQVRNRSPTVNQSAVI